MTSIHSKGIRAHRLSWQLYRGPIPPGLWVLHTCDNPSCVNPAHLWLGTHLDNVRDKVAKGRDKDPPHMRGATHASARISEADARYIIGSRGETLRALAQRFGVGRQHVYKIRAGLRWKCLRDRPIEGTPPEV